MGNIPPEKYGDESSKDEKIQGKPHSASIPINIEQKLNSEVRVLVPQMRPTRNQRKNATMTEMTARVLRTQESIFSHESDFEMLTYADRAKKWGGTSFANHSENMKTEGEGKWDYFATQIESITLGSERQMAPNSQTQLPSGNQGVNLTDTNVLEKFSPTNNRALQKIDHIGKRKAAKKKRIKLEDLVLAENITKSTESGDLKQSINDLFSGSGLGASQPTDLVPINELDIIRPSETDNTYGIGPETLALGRSIESPDLISNFELLQEPNNYILEENKSVFNEDKYKHKKTKAKINLPYLTRQSIAKPDSQSGGNINTKPKTAAIFDIVSLLPNHILTKITLYTIDSFREMLCVNPTWYNSLRVAMDLYFNHVENQFVNKYGSHLLFKNSYTSSQLIKVSDGKGLRLDRVIKCENIFHRPGYSVTIAYTYSYCNDPKAIYCAQFVFDSVKCGPRIVWAFRNQTKFHGDEEARTNTMGILPICEGDNIEFAITLYSLRGLMDISSITWKTPKIARSPIENILSYNRDAHILQKEGWQTKANRPVKLMADLNRICELEDSEITWLNYKYFVHLKTYTHPINPERFEPLFQVKKIEFTEVDIVVSKIHLVAKTPGYFSWPELGINIRVIGPREELSNEVKHLGLLIDRHSDLEFRPGDIFVFYIAKGGQSYTQQQIINI